MAKSSAAPLTQYCCSAARLEAESGAAKSSAAPATNFHLKNGIYFRRDGDKFSIVRATDFTDSGEVIVDTDMSGLASIMASASPHNEQDGSFYYALEFLTKGMPKKKDTAV